MGVGDFFKKGRVESRPENVEAKASELAAEKAAKETTIAEKRTALSGQVLEGDNLAAHRIEAELRVVNALEVAKEKLEAKAVELDEAEAEAADLAAYESDIARNEKFARNTWRLLRQRSRHQPTPPKRCGGTQRIFAWLSRRRRGRESLPNSRTR